QPLVELRLAQRDRKRRAGRKLRLLELGQRVEPARVRGDRWRGACCRGGRASAGEELVKDEEQGRERGGEQAEQRHSEAALATGGRPGRSPRGLSGNAGGRMGRRTRYGADGRHLRWVGSVEEVVELAHLVLEVDDRSLPLRLQQAAQFGDACVETPRDRVQTF